MPDEASTTPSTSQANAANGIDISKIKTFKDWLTGALAAIAAATIPNLVIKGFAAGAAPFVADGLINAVEWAAREYTAARKRSEPLRFARQYRKTIIANLKKVKPNSNEAKQLKSDLTETDRSIHEIMMHRIRFSVSTALPGAPPLASPPAAPTPPPPTAPQA